jgi:Flp pilus assembly protein TadG
MRPQARTCETVSDRRGAAAAELAIVLPFLALMFTATLDFCRIFHTSQAIQNSAEAAALYASGTTENPNASSTTDAAQKAAVAESPSLNPPLKTENVSVTITGNIVLVTVTYDFAMLTPFLGSDGVTTIKRTVTMNVAPGGP